MKRLLFVALFLEIGLVLMVVPWSAFWDRNYFAQLFPPLHQFMTNNFVRGAVSGLGLLNVAVGLTEIASIVLARASHRPVTINPSSLAED